MPLPPITAPLHFDTPEDQCAHMCALADELRRAAQLPVGRPAAAPEPTEPKRVAVVVGHNSRRQGAYSIPLGVSEYEFWGPRAEQIGPMLHKKDHTVKVFHRKPSLPDYPAEMDEVAARVAEWTPDFIWSLHFNSFHDEQAHGAEALTHAKIGPSAEAAATWLRDWCAATGYHNRGIKLPNRGAYGLKVLRKIAPTVLVEPFFGSSPDDCGKVGTDFNRLLAESMHAAMEATL